MIKIFKQIYNWKKQIGDFKWLLLCFLFLPLLLFYIPDIITYLLGKEIENRTDVPLESYQACYERAKEHFDKHKYYECIKDCNSCLKFDNKHAEPYVMKALAYIKLKDYMNALQAIGKAINISRKAEYLTLEKKIIALQNNIKPKKQTKTYKIAKEKQEQIIANTNGLQEKKAVSGKKAKVEKKYEGLVKIKSCTIRQIMSLEGFDEEKAAKFMQERKEGKLWYDIDSFVMDFELQPHEMVLIQDRLIFPPKAKNKSGRKIDW